MMRLEIAFHTATSALGPGLDALRQAIGNRATGLRPNDLENCDLDTWIGRVPGIEDTILPDALHRLDSRNNRLAWLGLQQDDFIEKLKSVRDQFGADRVGVIIGTSTSSIENTERAYRSLSPDGAFPSDNNEPRVHNMHSTGLFLTEATGLTGPSITISTACSSSAKVFATAHRWISQGLIDAALVGGVDSLCQNTLYGFNSLQLVSEDLCRPFDRRRNGINLGEAAAYSIVTRADDKPGPGIRLLGFGESSDAHHMSHPHPEGKGAILAMNDALKSAGLTPADVDYINLHGTGTQANDGIEAIAVNTVMGRARQSGNAGPVPASSTKGWTGHTLGAAGMLESVVVVESMLTQTIPGTINCEQPDDALTYPIITRNQPGEIRYALSNSFGFGGSNATLAFGMTHD